MTDINGLKIKEFVYNKVINSDCNYKNFKYHIDITDGWGNDVLAVLVELPKEVDISFIFSGNYEKYVMFNGIRYSHIIDPRTGYPATGIVSVSVFSKQTEIADALATGVFVLGIEVGLNLINQLKGIECIIVDDKGKIFTSKGIDIKKFE
jgi:thiamine biosynthesis lipoprotein ApbE